VVDEVVGAPLRDRARGVQARWWGLCDVVAGAVARQRPPAPVHRDIRVGVNVVGYFNAALGLTEAARGMLIGLDAAGVPVAPVAVRAAPGPQAEPGFTTLPPAEAPYGLNLICANGDGVRGIRRRAQRTLLSGRHSVALWWWEVAPAPARWSDASAGLDEIWVCSDHVLKTVTPVACVPVVKVRQPVAMPIPGSMSRRALDLPEGFLFHFVFDYASTFLRKNPVGVVEAFRRAFPDGSGPHLVIRSLNAGRHRHHRRLLARAAAGRRDIRIVDLHLTAPERHAMLGHIDCYISLHRAEGFGLVLAEAMRLGKPVIATGWSGNREFMTETNSYLVGHSLTPVGHGAWPYAQDGEWAEPDLDHAAELMRAVVGDPAAAAQRGARAALDLHDRHDPATAGALLAERVEHLAASATAASV